MFVYNGRILKLSEAKTMANAVGLVSYVGKRISEHGKIDNTKANNVYLSNKYKSFQKTHTVIIETYRPRWKYSKAMGYSTKAKPGVVFINKYIINKVSINSIVSLMHHESIHDMDIFDKENDYGHVGNSKKGNENTLPYLVNSFIGDYYGLPKTISPGSRFVWYKPWTWFN